MGSQKFAFTCVIDDVAANERFSALVAIQKEFVVEPSRTDKGRIELAHIDITLGGNLVWKKLFGSKGVSDEDLYRPRMPDVDVLPKVEDIFAGARQAAGGETRLPDARPTDRHVIIVTPGRMLIHHPCPTQGSMAPGQVASIEKMIPSATKRAIAVIAYTELQAITTDISKAIPFAGMLLGCAYIGHAVWVFEGHLSALVAGCRDADVLLVDGGMLPHLTEDWVKVVASAMRSKEIYVHDRATYRLSRVGAG